MLALVPPKPKLFDSATSIGRSCATLATRSIALSRDGLSRLRVGGATPSRMARIEKMPSTAPAAPSRWPMADLVEDIASLPAASPHSRSTAPQFQVIAERRRGAVGVDVLDLVRGHPGAAQRGAHGAEGAVAVSEGAVMWWASPDMP